MYIYNDGTNGTNRVIITVMIKKDDILCIHKNMHVEK